ncbi:hypothetical protein N7466_011635 [Penicillium verhagenii]|uniref:uncharacterized protein n=1 Tax=Penicillium verhagenii TaxID=1562060 RepID=UPI002544D849|nr:uncharacterized protein N7466_011635 [Penicillium verhagenii]KAJ5915702.1 hypothetical protein N7466_011635 [Penicillium verhagenii]
MITVPTSTKPKPNPLRNLGFHSFQFPIPISFPWWAPWAGILALIGLSLVVAIAYVRGQGYPNRDLANPAVWSALSDMEKANASQNPESPPPASALHVLKPLSLCGTFPSSGAVAARAREQMQMHMQTSSGLALALGDSPGMPELEAHPHPHQASDGGENGLQLQRRSGMVQTMYETDETGARTFRRLVVEYN